MAQLQVPAGAITRPVCHLGPSPSIDVSGGDRGQSPFPISGSPTPHISLSRGSAPLLCQILGSGRMASSQADVTDATSVPTRGVAPRGCFFFLSGSSSSCWALWKRLQS